MLEPVPTALRQHDVVAGEVEPLVQNYWVRANSGWESSPHRILRPPVTHDFRVLLLSSENKLYKYMT